MIRGTTIYVREDKSSHRKTKYDLITVVKGVKYFTPNDETHKVFGDALREAVKKGLKVIVFDCFVTEDSIEAGDMVEFSLCFLKAQGGI